MNTDLRVRVEKKDNEEFWTVWLINFHKIYKFISKIQQFLIKILKYIIWKIKIQIMLSELEIQAVIGFTGILTI